MCNKISKVPTWVVYECKLERFCALRFFYSANTVFLTVFYVKLFTKEVVIKYYDLFLCLLKVVLTVKIIVFKASSSSELNTDS